MTDTQRPAPYNPQVGQAGYQSYQTQPTTHPYNVAPSAAQSPHKVEYMRTPLTSNQPLSPSGRSCRDLPWAIAFVIQLIVIFVLSVIYYQKAGAKVMSGASSSQFVNKDFWGLAMLVFFVGLICAVAWVYLIQRFAKSLIWFALYLNIGMWIAMGIVGFIVGSIAWGLICFVIAGITGLWIWCVKDRIEFASTMISISVRALMEMPWNFILPPLSAAVQLVWSLIWVMGFSFVVYDAQQNSGKTNGLILFVFILSFYWTSQVIANVVLVTIMGSVATWYFMYPDDKPAYPVYDSFKRAATTSFGSVCFGSFIVAFIQAVRFMVNQISSRDHPCARAIANCILGCIEDMMNYFNMYAYAQVAIYGKTYCQAGRDTWSLFVSKGFDAVINDDLVHAVFWLTSMVSAAFTGLVALLAAKVFFRVPQYALWGLVGLMVGFVLTLCVTIVIGGAVKCLFVCFADDPAILSEKKPVIYTEIESAWKRMYGKLPSRLIGA